VKFAFIDEEKAHWPIDALCDVLSVSRSGYYAWKGRPAAPRDLEDAQLVVEIKAAYAVGRGGYARAA
jgi:putative transposase